jgi:AraC-like DNA-binding protein
VLTSEIARAARVALYDYLFATAATLREGFAASDQYLHLLTTHGRLWVEAETERATVYSYSHACGEECGTELALRRSVAALCARAQAETGQPVTPVHVGVVRSGPPASGAPGTGRTDTEAPLVTFAFSVTDLDLPMCGADPVLAEILRGYAASLPPPPPASWIESFRRHLGEAVDDSSASLTGLARGLAVSPRTLQRRLAQHGTTWRAELDMVRQGNAERGRQAGTTMTSLAKQLGYADTSSLRRARRRWETSPAGTVPGRPA